MFFDNSLLNEEIPKEHKGKYYPNGIKFIEAVEHARYGQGPVSMPLSAIDLSKVKVSDFKGPTLEINLVGKKYRTNWNDPLVHGTITLMIVKDNIVTISPTNDNEFDFRVEAKNNHPWFGQGHQFWRNVETLLLESFVGQNNFSGYKPFTIYYEGTAKITY